MSVPGKPPVDKPNYGILITAIPAITAMWHSLNVEVVRLRVHVHIARWTVNKSDMASISEVSRRPASTLMTSVMAAPLDRCLGPKTVQCTVRAL